MERVSCFSYPIGCIIISPPLIFYLFRPGQKDGHGRLHYLTGEVLASGLVRKRGGHARLGTGAAPVGHEREPVAGNGAGRKSGPDGFLRKRARPPL